MWYKKIKNKIFKQNIYKPALEKNLGFIKSWDDWFLENK